MMKKTPTAVSIAKYLVALANSKGEYLTNKKLQKILYYVQSWHLVYFNSPLFDEHPEAWTHGPVYPTVYAHFKEYGYNPVSLYEYGEGITAGEVLKNLVTEKKIKKKSRELIFAVLKKYGTLSSLELEVLTHSETPWLEQRKGLGEFDSSGRDISHESMKKSYSAM